MFVLRHLRHAPLLLVGVACAEPGAAAIAQGNRAALGGHFDQAVASFQQACTEAPKDARAHALLGNALWSDGKEEQAAVAWDDAAQLEPGQPDALLGLARVELKKNDVAAALARLEKIAGPGAARTDVRTLRALALIRRNGAGDVGKALEDSQAALRAAPKDPTVLYARGSVLIAARQYTEAQAAFDALLKVAPDSSLAHYGLARLSAALARKTDVLYHLRDARTASPQSWQPAQVAADQAFAFLKDDPDFTELSKP